MPKEYRKHWVIEYDSQHSQKGLWHINPYVSFIGCRFSLNFNSNLYGPKGWPYPPGTIGDFWKSESHD